MQQIPIKSNGFYTNPISGSLPRAKKLSVYYLSRKFNLEQQGEDFLEKASEQLGIYQPKITKWDAALKFIVQQIKGKPVIIIDEVPYLIEGNSAVMSSFQAAWDLHLKDANVMVILLGSSIGMMENEVLGYKSPLYGRRTGQIKLEPLKFAHLTHFFPQKSAEEMVQTYGCLGGCLHTLTNLMKTSRLSIM